MLLSARATLRIGASSPPIAAPPAHDARKAAETQADLFADGFAELRKCVSEIKEEALQRQVAGVSAQGPGTPATTTAAVSFRYACDTLPLRTSSRGEGTVGHEAKIMTNSTGKRTLVQLRIERSIVL